MIRKIAVAATAVLMTASPLAYAADTSSTVGMRHPSAADLNALTDARVGVSSSLTVLRWTDKLDLKVVPQEAQ